jgi:hypothetical protein
MLEIIISTILLISPGDSTSVPFDITILFDPPAEKQSIRIYLDGSNLPGELQSDYFFSEVNNILTGEHKIKVETGNETEEWSFIVTKKTEENPYIFTGNLSIGNYNSYSTDTLYTTENEILSGLDELTICSPAGYGLSGEIGIGNFSLTPVILYSEDYDTLFTEYPRWLLGGKITFKKDPLWIGFTVFYGEDDTSNIMIFPFVDPQKSTVLSGETRLWLNKALSLKIKGAFSRGNPNLYADSTTEGNAFEGKFIFESNLNSIEAGIRNVSEGYLTPGNPYLYTGRLSGFANGIYEIGSFSTYFEYLAYEEEENLGISLIQSFKWKLTSYFAPIMEYQWAEYPEYFNEKYSYIGGGFELTSSSLQIENTLGTEKTTYFEETNSLRILSNLSWYHEKHMLSLGFFSYLNGSNTSFDFSMDGTLSLGSFGNININYYPYLENGYKEHLLRIIYEYDF